MILFSILRLESESLYYRSLWLSPEETKYRANLATRTNITTLYYSTEALLTLLYNKLVMVINKSLVVFDTILTHRLSSFFEYLEPPYRGSSRTFPHALSLSMSLVTHLIRKEGENRTLRNTCEEHLKVLFSPSRPSSVHLYTAPLIKLISSSSVNHHLNADDTQLFMSFSLSLPPRCTKPYR